MSRFTITVDGVPEFSRAFNRGVDRLNDLTPVWKELAADFYDIVRMNLIDEGRSGQSGAYAPLSEPYATIKAAKWGDKNILEASGRLYKSFHEGASDNVTVMKKDEAAFGTSVPYAIHHQRGTRKMPKREIISLTDKDKDRMTKRMQKKLVELMREAGLMSRSRNR